MYSVEVSYTVKVTIEDESNKKNAVFTKDFKVLIEQPDKETLYDNTHVIKGAEYVLDLFESEVKSYLADNNADMGSVVIDEYEIVSHTKRADVFFENPDDPGVFTLSPCIKCYLWPEHDPLAVPVLRGKAYDANSIIWEWDDDGYEHLLITEPVTRKDWYDKKKVIAAIPAGINTYTETGLRPATAHTRRLIAYTAEQTSLPSVPCVVSTESEKPSYSVEEYMSYRNHDWTITDEEREYIKPYLEAMHAGVGDFNDCKVYKQTDDDFYEKFRAYYILSGTYTKREKRYEQVGFRYKIKLDALETIEEMEGMVDFKLDAYPWQEVYLNEYLWATMPVNVYAKVCASVQVYKETTSTYKDTIEASYEYSWEEPITSNETLTIKSIPLIYVLCIDLSGSMVQTNNKVSAPFIEDIEDADGKVTRFRLVLESVKKMLSAIKKKVDKYNDNLKTEFAKAKYKLSEQEQKDYLKKYKIRTDDASADYGVEIHIMAFAKTVKYDDKSPRSLDNAIDFFKNISNKREGTKQFGCPDGEGYLNGTHLGHHTNWISALGCMSYYMKQIAKKKKHSVHIFFSDGFPWLCNIYSDPTFSIGDYSGKYPGQKETEGITAAYGTATTNTQIGGKGLRNKISDIVTNKIKPVKSKKDKTLLKYAYIIGKSSEVPSKMDSGWDNPQVITANGVRIWTDISTNGSNPKSAKEWANSVKEAVGNESLSGTGKFKLEEIGDIVSNTNGIFQSVLETEVTEIIDIENTEIEKHENGGTIKVSAKVPITTKEAKIISIESELLKFTFDQYNTKITYNPVTKKAEILENNKLYDTKMCTEGGELKSIKYLLQDALEAKIASDPELEGYTAISVEDDETGQEVSKLYKNIHIKDTWGYADEDGNTISDLGGKSGWQYGRMGTVNTFTNIVNVGGTEGDDDYVVLEDSYVWINGYTDAIIYDGIRYGHANVCAYYKCAPSVTMFPVSEVSDVLTNRMMPSLHYSGPVDSSHVFKEQLMIKTPNPNYTTITGDGIDTDMVVLISKYFESPRLDYRFNMLDPNAFTPYYEILPDCNPDSQDKHCIVITVYEADNVCVNPDASSNNWIDKFNYEEPPQPPMLFEYGLNSTWDSTKGVFDCDGHYIGEYVHFNSLPMLKTQPYTDTLPPEGEDSYYGLVNGRYREDNPTGKQDLVVETPHFNIPWSVLATHSDTIKIYIEVTEMTPEDALVEYQWLHENPAGSGYTNINGDYVKFTCDSPTMMDIEYKDVISTIQTDWDEIFTQKPYEKIMQITCPKYARHYEHYLLEAHTDNGDVIVSKYPREIMFDPEWKAEFPVTYQGVINATSLWAPRVHNGYYYFNQHENFLYAEHNVKSDNFIKTIDMKYDNETVFILFHVKLWKDGGPTEYYSIDKDTKVELLQNEKWFKWVEQSDETGDDWGLTLKPLEESTPMGDDGKTYKNYVARTWTSPVIGFPNTLTTAGPLTVTYRNTDGSSSGLAFKIRAYDTENARWPDWSEAEPFTNGSVPSKLSAGYQLRCELSATVVDTPYDWEDYLCCYLDWCDYLDDEVSYNINTSTDHITVGPLKNDGRAVSKILDFVCPSIVMMSYFASDYTPSLSCAFSNDYNDMLMEFAAWVPASNISVTGIKYRYWRFKIEIPYGVNVYWIRLNVQTQSTSAVLPFIQRITMTGSHEPEDLEAEFDNLESFVISADGRLHDVVSKIGRYIDSDIIEKGFTRDDIKKLTITCPNKNCYLAYDSRLDAEDPAPALMDTGIQAAAEEEKLNITSDTPFIKPDHTGRLIIKGCPQQYCPVTLEADGGIPMKRVYGAQESTMLLTEVHIPKTEDNYLELKRTDFELSTVSVWYGDTQVYNWKIVNHLLIFDENYEPDVKITVRYAVENSFMVLINRGKNTTTIIPYTNQAEFKKHEEDRSFRCEFETSLKTNKYKTKLSMNPVYRTEYSGFIYMTREHIVPYRIRISCEPGYLMHGGLDTMDINIEVVDTLDNPVIYKEVALDCLKGSIKLDNAMTDANGVVHAVYTSCFTECTDTITASVIMDDMSVLSEKKDIINY